MPIENLFGTPAEQAELAATVAQAPRRFTQDAMTPTIIFSIIFCPSVVALSIAFCTR